PTRCPARIRRSAINKLIETYEKVLDRLASAILATLLLIVLAQIISRYVFNSSLPWTEEAARYLMIWGVLLGAGLAYLNGYLISIEIFINRFPAPVRRVVRVVNRLLSLFFTGILTVYGVHLCILGAQMESPAMEISYLWIYLAVPVGAGFLFLLFLTHPLKK
ncbi:MAG: TRAP transporter small permease, partial [Proteobacteria bacterium]|nr:TRAP transporter small permease [Pseudomonadota bacterium]